MRRREDDPSGAWLATGTFSVRAKKWQGSVLLKQWRQRLGLTQRGAAQVFGMAESQYEAYETGKRPGLVNAVVFQQQCGVPCEAWVTKAGVVGANNVADPSGQTPRVS